MFDEGQLYSPVTRTDDGTVEVHLSENHPGLHDADYRARRAEIAGAAPDAIVHELTDLPPNVDPRKAAEQLEGNIGYIKFNYFADPEMCGQTASAAMNFVAGTQALIVDLRENGGGSPAMVQSRSDQARRWSATSGPSGVQDARTSISTLAGRSARPAKLWETTRVTVPASAV